MKNTFQKIRVAALASVAVGCAVGCFGVAAYMQLAYAQVGANLPFVTGVTVANSVTTIIGANASRRGLKICNVGATNDVWIAPVNTTGLTVAPAALGAGSFLLSRTSAAGANVVVNCINMPADVGGAGGGIPTVVTSGFAGITNAATSPVTVWEY
jgi:hypothetical protein